MRVLVLGGDGIGPEVVDASMPLLIASAQAANVSLDIEQHVVGGALYDLEGVFINEPVKRLAKQADFILFGAEGGPKWDSLPREGAQEDSSANFWLRRKLDLYSNFRPVKPFAALSSLSALRAEISAVVDLVVVRELCGGIYFGEPRGRETTADGLRRATDTQVYTEHEVSRVAHDAFALARSRRGRLTSMDKSNVLESGVIWREVITEIGAQHYPDVTLQHLYADNGFFQLGSRPGQFDVILCDNLFGDLMSDAAAVSAGSLGLLPSASLGPPQSDGWRQILYESVHGSAPDIAGRGIANPIATLLCVAMAAELSFQRPDIAQSIRVCIEATLQAGIRTPDIGGDATTQTLAEDVVRRFKSASLD